jgi:hypothetical protein
LNSLRRASTKDTSLARVSGEDHEQDSRQRPFLSCSHDIRILHDSFLANSLSVVIRPLRVLRGFAHSWHTGCRKAGQDRSVRLIGSASTFRIQRIIDRQRKSHTEGTQEISKNRRSLDSLTYRQSFGHSIHGTNRPPRQSLSRAHPHLHQQMCGVSLGTKPSEG